MVWSCFHPTNSWISCANGWSPVAAHISPPTRTAKSDNATIRPVLNLRWGSGGIGFELAAGSLTPLVLAGMLTGLPHFAQNSAPSGKVAPHLLQARTAIAV